MLGLGSSATLGIGLAVYLDDRFTNPSKRLTEQVKAMGMSVNQFRGHVRTLEVFAGGVFLAAEALQRFAKFDKTMTAAGIIGGAEKGTEGFAQLEAQTMALSKTYGQLPNEIALTNLELAKAGKSVPEIMKLSEAVTNLGAATDTKVGGAGGAAEMLVNTMQAFNAASEEADKYADIMTSAANRSTIDVTDLYESLKYSSDVARTLNIPFQEAATAIATLGNAGLKGSMAGVAYANMLRYIATGVTEFGTKKQQKALASMGLTGNDFRDAQGNLKDLGSMLEILRKKTAGMNDPDKLGVLTAIFGVRGARGLVPLMSGMTTDEQGNQVQTYADMKKGIASDSGIAQTTAQKRVDNLAGDFAKVMAAWDRMLIRWGKTLEPMARALSQALVKLLDGITTMQDSKFGSTLIRAATLWFMVIKPLKALFAIFGSRIFGSAFIATMSAGTAQSAKMRANLVAGANAIVAAMLKARGIAMMGPGGATLMGRGAGGRVTGGLGKATWVAKIVGSIFGRSGLRGLSALKTFFAKISSATGWLGKLMGWFVVGGGWMRTLGFILGRVVGFLFGWPVMIADIALTLITGKGVFERLWGAITWLYDIMVGIGSWLQTSWLGKFIDKLTTPNEKPLNEGYRHTPAGGTSPQARAQDDFKNTYNNLINKEKQGINLHVTVNPTTGDQRTEHFINARAEQQLAGIGIKS